MTAVRVTLLAALAAILLAAGSLRAQESTTAPEPQAEAGTTQPEPQAEAATPPPAEAAPLAAAETSPPAPAAEQDGEKEEEREDHKGFLFRFTIGLGWAWIFGDGSLAPAIGLPRVDEPHHTSPAFNVSMDFGGGFKNIGIHVGGVFERMILRADTPVEMGFTLFGVGGGLSYYFTEYDFYATAQVRFMGLRLYLPGVLCGVELGEKYQSYQGPGVTVGLGKEWFGDNDKGLGLGLQFNYAKLKSDPWAEFDYVSLMLALTFTKF
jgi:hypothetical protein